MRLAMFMRASVGCQHALSILQHELPVLCVVVCSFELVKKACLAGWCKSNVCLFCHYLPSKGVFAPFHCTAMFAVRAGLVFELTRVFERTRVRLRVGEGCVTTLVYDTCGSRVCLPPMKSVRFTGSCSGLNSCWSGPP